jgi:hypothetical protein
MRHSAGSAGGAAGESGWGARPPPEIIQNSSSLIYLQIWQPCTHAPLLHCTLAPLPLPIPVACRRLWRRSILPPHAAGTSCGVSAVISAHLGILRPVGEFHQASSLVEREVPWPCDLLPEHAQRTSLASAAVARRS